MSKLQALIDNRKVIIDNFVDKTCTDCIERMRANILTLEKNFKDPAYIEGEKILKSISNLENKVKHFYTLQEEAATKSEAYLENEAKIEKLTALMAQIDDLEDEVNSFE